MASSLVPPHPDKITILVEMSDGQRLEYILDNDPKALRHQQLHMATEFGYIEGSAWGNLRNPDRVDRATFTITNRGFTIRQPDARPWTEYADDDRTTWPPDGSTVEFLRGDPEHWAVIVGEVVWDKHGAAMRNANANFNPTLLDPPEMKSGVDNRYWRPV